MIEEAQKYTLTESIIFFYILIIVSRRDVLNQV